MAYNFIRFAIKYRHAILVILAVLSAIGTGFYIRHIQDKIAIAEAEIKNNRIQQEYLRESLNKKEKSNAKVKTSSYDEVINTMRINNWMRVD